MLERSDNFAARERAPSIVILSGVKWSGMQSKNLLLFPASSVQKN